MGDIIIEKTEYITNKTPGDIIIPPRWGLNTYTYLKFYNNFNPSGFL